jgi:predicted aspartyl protease
MKYLLSLQITGALIFISGFSIRVHAQNDKSAASVFNKRLDSLLDQKNYFQLDAQLKQLENSLDQESILYYQCFIDNAFNHNIETVTHIDQLLRKYSASLTDSIIAVLLLLEADSYFKQFQYAQAFMVDSIVLSHYASSLDSATITDVKNDCLIRKPLAIIPPQETIISSDVTIQWKKDKMGIFEIPVQFNSETYSCVFDTKANMSCITESYASKLGLKLLDASIDVGSGLTGIHFKTGLGVADSLYIGNILVKNAIFLVMPDAKLRLSPFFSIHVIIGFPIIEQLKEIQFYKDGRMVIPINPSTNNLHNLALDGLNPVVSLQADKDTLCFDLDLGAANTNLYATYFKKYQATILNDAKKSTVRLGGAGGSKKKNIYVIPSLDLVIGNKTVSLHKVNVLQQKTSSKERYYGNLGQDFIGELEGFILNFSTMYFKGI